MNSNLILVALLAGSLLGCRGSSGPPPVAPSAAPAPAAVGDPAGHGDEAPGHADEHGHAHGHAEEGSDLDRPVEELFEAACEHDRKTFSCDECRYEVGVARAPAQLFSDGLLAKVAASKRRVEAPLALTGEIRFDDRRVAHLSAQTEGVIRKVHVSLGDKVRRGQPLVEIESAGFGQAESEHLESQATLELARRNLERQRALREDGITSEKEFLIASQEHEAARIRARTAADKLVQLGLSPAELKGLGQGSARTRLILRAPADGLVLLLHAVPGEVAKAAEPLLTVGDLGALWLWADLYESDLGRVAALQASGKLQALVSVKAFPDEEFPGVVDLVGPTMDESTRTVKVRIGLDNSAGKLRAGMFARVRLFLPGPEEVLAVPRAALLEDEGRAFVFVHHHDDYYVRRPVTRGRSWAGWVEITEGLDGSEAIVGDGAFLLKSDVLRSKMGAGCAD